MEEPSHKEAEGLLAEVFERTGYDSELVELLNQQLLTAQEAKDAEAWWPARCASASCTAAPSPTRRSRCTAPPSTSRPTTAS
jgi:alkyl sulfatase BDS1-like metallo-beta-lactamase superfamily hydrolase